METEHRPDYDDEISLVDIIRFFGRQWKLIGITTLGLTAVAVAYSLIQQADPFYQKSLTFSVEPTTVPFSGSSGVAIPTYSNTNQANNAATEFLNEQKNDDQEDDAVSLNATYDKEADTVNLTLQAPTPEPLPTATEETFEQLAQDFQQSLESEIRQELAQLETRLSREQVVLRTIEAEIAETPGVAANTDNPRLGSLEGQRARQIALMTELKFDQQYLQKALADLEDFTEQIYSLEVQEESDIQQQSSSRSPVQVGVLALIAGFMVAVLAAIIREQIPQIRAELAKTEHQRLNKS
ncbi:hypothetical protein PN462_18585 [Spirulina sp. CS-785/01]|uniref:hypothetical protein n=1 Tax=Spirulina sp. CS-785/01 TaxID=3021716 RepID=UPI00232FA99B|nr:hypothetical protein [Spirulina sp. CS-785/01]MDB9315129.1 hypothetical protein [Spirulina sp. CS-785/01]